MTRRIRWTLLAFVVGLFTADVALLFQVRRERTTIIRMQAASGSSQGAPSIAGALDVFSSGGSPVLEDERRRRSLIIFALDGHRMAEDREYWHQLCMAVSQGDNVGFIGFCYGPDCDESGKAASARCFKTAGFGSLVLGRTLAEAETSGQFLVIGADGSVLARPQRRDLSQTTDEIKRVLRPAGSAS